MKRGKWSLRQAEGKLIKIKKTLIGLYVGKTHANLEKLQTYTLVSTTQIFKNHTTLNFHIQVLLLPHEFFFLIWHGNLKKNCAHSDFPSKLAVIQFKIDHIYTCVCVQVQTTNKVC